MKHKLNLKAGMLSALVVAGLTGPALADPHHGNHAHGNAYGHAYGHGQYRPAPDDRDHDRGWGREHYGKGGRDVVVVAPRVEIRGPYAGFFLGSSGYYKDRYPDYNGWRVIRSDIVRAPASYTYRNRRIQPEECRRVFYVKRKDRGDAIFSELVCRDRFGYTHDVPGSRTFEGWDRR